MLQQQRNTHRSSHIQNSHQIQSQMQAHLQQIPTRGINSTNPQLQMHTNQSQQITTSQVQQHSQNQQQQVITEEHNDAKYVQLTTNMEVS